MGSGCPTGETLVLHVEGELDERERDAIARHLSECPVCAGAVASLTRLTGLLRRASERDRSGPGVCPRGEAAAAYADGSLGPEESRAFEHHLAGCQACLAEVADLWRLEGPQTIDVPETVVGRVLERLNAGGARAAIRWAERSLTLVTGFADHLGEALATPEPVPAAARAGGAEVNLRWSGEGTVCHLRLRVEAGGPTVTGLLTDAEGLPERGLSVGLRSEAGDRGPESTDAGGRFGPWTLATGDNAITLRGVGVERGIELLLAIEGDGNED